MLTSGFSKGFIRHKSEFYVDDKSPKKYWIYPLAKKAQQLLSNSSPLPDIFQKGTSEGLAGARCALDCKHLRSLSDAFYTLKKRIDSSMTQEQKASPPLKRTRKTTINTQKIFSKVAK
ncbi:MAG: hypothetical protein ACI9E1_000318 [Cryomorphaceae bacterium]